MEGIKKIKLFITVFLFLSISFIAKSANSSTLEAENFCKNYNWGKVELLVAPHIDGNSFTTLVMQGISAEYNTSAAAYQAISPQLPKDIHDILSQIIKFNCP